MWQGAYRNPVRRDATWHAHKPRLTILGAPQRCTVGQTVLGAQPSPCDRIFVVFDFSEDLRFFSLSATASIGILLRVSYQMFRTSIILYDRRREKTRMIGTFLTKHEGHDCKASGRKKEKG
jgi:hypothetical protein